jgi:hypothetical protein
MDNRAHRRLGIKAAVSLTVAGGRPLHGWIKNISISGLHVRTDESLPLGARCQVTLVVRDGNERRRMVLDGVVKRRDAEGMGVQFAPMADDLKRALSLALLESQGVVQS